MQPSMRGFVLRGLGGCCRVTRVTLGAALLALWVPAAAPAQVVQYYHLDAVALRHASADRLRATLSERADGRVERVGSVRALTDQTGAVVARYDYEPFGEPPSLEPSGDDYSARATASQGVGPPAVPHERRQFTGQVRDAETGLDYFGARYYRADLGRFLTVDPGNASATLPDPQGWNAYAYARNNPLRYVDPDGLAWRVDIDGYSPVWFQNDRDFELMLACPELNPGITFEGGVVYAGGRRVGTYRHFSDFDAVVGMAGDLGAYGLRREGMEMARWAASGALSPINAVPFIAKIETPLWVRLPLPLKSFSQKIIRGMKKRGWTEQEVYEAIATNRAFTGVNNATGARTLRFVHPRTGKSVVVDASTGNVIQVGGPGFRW